MLRNRLIAPLLLLSVTLIGGGIGCANDQKVISQARDFHTSLKPAVMDGDAQLTTYLQTVGDRILVAAGEYYKAGKGPSSSKKEDSSWMFKPGGLKFHFVNSKTLNAFTTGGEHMYIYTELFRQCSSEDELAAVMSHEFAHVYCRHVQKGMNRQMETMALAAGAGAAGYAAGGSDQGATYAGALGSAAMLVGQFAGMSYTRADENEADKYGFVFYTRAGWDPDHFGDFFQKMIDKGLDTTPEMMSDHPTLRSRVAATKDRASRLKPETKQWRKPPVAGPAEFRQLQDRATQLGKTMPDDTSLKQTQALLAAMPRSCLTPRDNVNLPDQKAAQQQVVTDINSAAAKQQQSSGQKHQKH
jgi:predicted Zn-dependent protease